MKQNFDNTGSGTATTYRSSRLLTGDYRNILIIKPSALGDVARAIPAVVALRNQYPQARITWLVRPEFSDLVRHNPAINDIILFDKRKFTGVNLASFRAARNFRLELKSKEFDLVLDMQGLLRSGLMTWQTGAPVRIGLRKARELAWLFYNLRVEAPKINHANDDCWRVVEAAGVSGVMPGFGVPIDPQAYIKADEILTNAGVKYDKDFIVLLPGATADSKIWPAENYARLASELFRVYNLKSVLLGAGPREKQLAGTIAGACSSEYLANLVGKTSLSEMVAVLSRSFLVIGNDSGPLHVAAALPKPVIGLYGPTNPDVVGPVSQRHNVIEAGASVPRTGRYSSNPAHTITNITVDNILTKFKEITAKNEKS